MYRLLAGRIAKSYTTLSIADYLSLQHGRRLSDAKRIAVFRHDVDAAVANAVAMAAVDASFGIRSTFYFRLPKGNLNERIVKKVADLGH